VGERMMLTVNADTIQPKNVLQVSSLLQNEDASSIANNTPPIGAPNAIQQSVMLFIANKQSVTLFIANYESAFKD
jgi:hypothetical protein